MSNFDSHADALAALVDDDTPKEVVEALEAAQEALAFSHSLWEVVKENGVTGAGEEPNYQVMERAIDAQYGELFAATMLFSNPAFGLESTLDKVADMFASQAKSIKENDINGDVPDVVVKGFARFAARLRNAKKTVSTVG